ncbi:hypothetical protein MRB53_034114 [Persea americana]|uniref:Uncharacterized protein n=1 Tax=Persea americana TaxID=3435 RepID=A0ACC2KWK8_PERAE|nr:hypothetical protein MRB53_034114 [Persea americana]
MFVVGTDTSSSTVEWGMPEILRRPDVYKKVMAELDQVVGKDRFVEETDIPKRSPTSKPQSKKYSGSTLESHSSSHAAPMKPARDPNVWPDPYEFRPGRFLGSEVDVKGLDFELLPFGTWRRSCVGMPLGHGSLLPCVVDPCI